MNEEDYKLLVDFGDTLPAVFKSKYFWHDGESLVQGYIRIMNFLIGYCQDDVKSGMLGILFGIEKGGEE